MRLKVRFYTKEYGTKLLPKDYRFYIGSFIDEITKTTNAFVFSLSFKKYQDHQIPDELIFSTGDKEIFQKIQKKFSDMKKKNEGIKIRNYSEILISDVFLLEKIDFDLGSALFSTEVCILTNPNAFPEDFNKWFCVPEDENFSEILEKRTLQRYLAIKGEKPSTKLIVRTEKSKTVCTKIYDGEEDFLIKGFKGIFQIESEPDILKFIYDYGLGIHTSRGFGLVHVLKNF